MVPLVTIGAKVGGRRYDAETVLHAGAFKPVWAVEENSHDGLQTWDRK